MEDITIPTIPTAKPIPEDVQFTPQLAVLLKQFTASAAITVSSSSNTSGVVYTNSSTGAQLHFIVLDFTVTTSGSADAQFKVDSSVKAEIVFSSANVAFQAVQTLICLVPASSTYKLIFATTGTCGITKISWNYAQFPS